MERRVSSLNNWNFGTTDDVTFESVVFLCISFFASQPTVSTSALRAKFISLFFFFLSSDLQIDSVLSDTV